jgi:hypothetical protein
MDQQNSGICPLGPTQALTPKHVRTGHLVSDNGRLAVPQGAMEDEASSCPSLTDDQSNSNGNLTPLSPRQSSSSLSIRSAFETSTQRDIFPTLPRQDATGLKSQPRIQESDCELVVSVAGFSWELPTLTADTITSQPKTT